MQAFNFVGRFSQATCAVRFWQLSVVRCQVFASVVCCQVFASVVCCQVFSSGAIDGDFGVYINLKGAFPPTRFLKFQAQESTAGSRGLRFELIGKPQGISHLTHTKATFKVKTASQITQPRMGVIRKNGCVFCDAVFTFDLTAYESHDVLLI